MADSLDGVTLGELRDELHRLVAMADSAERPKPDTINPPGHAMPGYEWRITQQAVPGARPPIWVVRTADDAEGADCVYVAQPDPCERDWGHYLEFCAVPVKDARRLAMALLAAADRAEHLCAGVPRLEDRRGA